MWNRKIALGAAMVLVMLMLVPVVARGSSASLVPVVKRGSSLTLVPTPGGYDQTPPVLTVDVKPAFVVGNIVTPKKYESQLADGTVVYTWYTQNIAEFTRWSATDDSGRVCYYHLVDLVTGEPVLEYTQQTQYTGVATDYDGTFGGGPRIAGGGFVVTAEDCPMNATSKVVRNDVTVNQEDNTTDTDSSHPSGQLTYKGPWATTYCDCFLGGKTARTTTQGARMTFTRTYGQGDHVALVMAEGPGRGQVAIRIDDKWLMNIDTYAPVNTNCVVVFERMMSAGTHSVAIVNLATPGRPRIDLDAVMTN